MRATERRLFVRTRDRLKPYMTLRRIENMVHDGDPDVFWYAGACSGWLELKVTDLPARPTTSVFKRGGLRDSQISTLLDYTRNGLAAHVWARAGDCTYLVDGRYAASFNTWTLEELAYCSVLVMRKRSTDRSWELLADLLRQTVVKNMEDHREP